MTIALDFRHLKCRFPGLLLSWLASCSNSLLCNVLLPKKVILENYLIISMYTVRFSITLNFCELSFHISKHSVHGNKRMTDAGKPYFAFCDAIHELQSCLFLFFHCSLRNHCSLTHRICVIMCRSFVSVCIQLLIFLNSFECFYYFTKVVEGYVSIDLFNGL